MGYSGVGAGVKINWNIDGFHTIRRSGPVQALVNQHTAALAAQAGEGFIGKTAHGRTRYRGIVVPDTYAARRRNARENTLARLAG